MAQKIKLKANDGSIVEFYDEIKARGGVKDVYFSVDKTYVVAFYRKKLDANDIERLKNIVNTYHQRIFESSPEGKYWEDYLIMPTRMVEWDGKIGVAVPFYNKRFFFSSGPFNGKEKEGKWFASAKLRNRFLPADQKGTWLTHLHMCIKIARAVRRLHAAGLAHSDLSYKNVLVDPVMGSACIIDADELVVPGKFPPGVIGTPDFIAPEVMETKELPIDDPKRKLPSIDTDRHALAVLIYMYLLNRHPLRGGKVHDLDPAKDEELSMGKNALFIELKDAGLSVETEVPFDVSYKGHIVGSYKADMIVEQKVVVELKATNTLAPVNEAQLVNYLTASGIDDGVLINFGSEHIQIRHRTRIYRPKAVIADT